ncbi:uncharacterized protein N7503_007229 [Penicillium pulvis]|uniref:uncharacterized protein n=1 Tax=Penicillium pulvis TaxID=1562058 RepID=UPI00254957DA|nr:uncharacterized protein N7503_007229 [Penicillium pulvis]KAJ5797933.1 hypothetical protein N7503_007229 [Penicillium pulvis]
MGSSITTLPSPAISPKRTALRPTRPSIFKRRVSKACEECRRRKAKCDGRTLCTPCTERGLYCCFYREKARDRTNPRSRTVDSLETGIQYRDSSSVPTKPPDMIEHTSSQSPSRIYQIHYGASSNISFLNHLYRSFESLLGGNRPIRLLNDFSKTLGQVGAENIESTMALKTCNKPVLLGDELSLSLAIEILEHFLALHQVLIPVLCPQALRNDLCAFYDPGSSYTLSNFRRRTLLLVLATASLTTKHHKVVDGLISQYYNLTGPSDDNLTMQSIEGHACYYTEKGLYSNAYLTLGSATRKVFSVGLHRDPPQGSRPDLEMEQQRKLVWILYNLESWLCVHLGRPSSFTGVQIAIPSPNDAFLLARVKLSELMNKCSKEIYIPSRGSLLSMWRAAESLICELHDYEDNIIATLGFGLHHRSQLGELDVQQTILTTLYLHTITLVFRPFAIFSGKLKAQRVCSESSDAGTCASQPWLDEVCEYALNATKRLIDYLSLAMSSNQIIKNMRYTHVFLENCCALLSYDILHNHRKVPTNVPFITKSLACLSQMRPGDSIQQTITAFQDLLVSIDPDGAWCDSDSNDWVSVNACNGRIADRASPIIHDPSTWHHTDESIEVLNDAVRRVIS